jgi:hypothetical protein
MPGPKEQTSRSLEFDPQRPVNGDPGEQRNAAVSSKRVKTEHGSVEKPPRSTRAARPGSGRAGSDSNASRRTRGG